MAGYRRRRRRATLSECKLRVGREKGLLLEIFFRLKTQSSIIEFEINYLNKKFYIRVDQCTGGRQ